LSQIANSEDLSVVINTGDDITLFGLYISPDVDIVTYTLAGVVDDKKGWGINGDTFQCLDMLKQFGVDTWFNLGDRDLGTHIYRTNRLKQGATLSEVADEIRCSLGVKAKILPMSNDRFETRIRTPAGSLHFEEYFVKNRCRDDFLGVDFIGGCSSKPAPGVLEAIVNADLVIVCPSNPIVSIGTILSVEGIKDALKRTNGRVVAVSPIVAGATIKGPADKMLQGLGFEVSAFGVAEFYADFLDTMVIDIKDSYLKERIERLDLTVTIANTMMITFQNKIELAKAVMQV
jgi:LPPG:FO 2-phospho-L-lactate transferase